MSVLGGLVRPLRQAVAGSLGRKRECRRCAHDFVRGPTQAGTYKVPLKSPKIVGVCSSRGNREYQEDATSVKGLQLGVKELQASLEGSNASWDPSKAGSDFLAGQVGYFSIFDGHGGKEVSSFAKDNLHTLIEEVDPGTTAEIIAWTQERHAGYFRRWKGGALKQLAEDIEAGNKRPMTLEERLTLAYLTADKQILESIEKSQRCGSTSTVTLLHSLDEPGTPYWGAKKLHLTVAHCGDTRALLCHRPTGEAITLTEKHHAESRVETARLRRMGADRLVSDSFGESRWMGVVENTRGFGDGEWKPSGITAEPEITAQVLDGEDYAYIILLTDGLTSLMSNQEVVDLARNAIDPTRAAKAIVHFGEDLGAQDNCTCVVIPLAGWGKVGGRDNTEERREYRRKQAGQLNTRMQRM